MRIDELVAAHCSPALAGIKAANMISCPKDKYPHIAEDVSRLNAELSNGEICLEILCECPKRALIIVYRRKTLEKYLYSPEISEFLTECGYDMSLGLSELTKELGRRISAGNGFPHEVGAFLGYPLHDIRGFINDPSDGYLCVGHWKVYEEEQAAREQFRRFDKCRDAVLKRISAGKTLSSIFKAA